jgi:2-C-methyl-D-erythritol 4-phosphate cytidylyltransferase / 2-C-methyl-D-erythritol 2,4-cyclodiphosphate synthase
VSEPDVRAAAILLAAGSGKRIGATRPKAFLPIGERPMLSVAAAAAAASPRIGALVVAAPPGYEDEARSSVEGLSVPTTVLTGGRTRQASVRAALSALAPDAEVVVVHDAARPFAPPDLFTEVIRAVEAGADGAIPVVPVTDTVKRLDGIRVVDTIDRTELANAQTPQAFRVRILRAAHERAATDGEDVTDDAALLERTATVVAVAGDPMNFKITTLLDLARAESRIGGVHA